jgi:hypothetical protein
MGTRQKPTETITSISPRTSQSTFDSEAPLRRELAASLALPHASMSASSLQGKAAIARLVIKRTARVKSCLALP